MRLVPCFARAGHIFWNTFVGRVSFCKILYQDSVCLKQTSLRQGLLDSLSVEFWQVFKSVDLEQLTTTGEKIIKWPVRVVGCKDEIPKCVIASLRKRMIARTGMPSTFILDRSCCCHQVYFQGITNLSFNYFCGCRTFTIVISRARNYKFWGALIFKATAEGHPRPLY